MVRSVPGLIMVLCVPFSTPDRVWRTERTVPPMSGWRPTTYDQTARYRKRLRRLCNDFKDTMHLEGMANFIVNSARWVRAPQTKSTRDTHAKRIGSYEDVLLTTLERKNARKQWNFERRGRSQWITTAHLVSMAAVRSKMIQVQKTIEIDGVMTSEEEK